MKRSFQTMTNLLIHDTKHWYNDIHTSLFFASHPGLDTDLSYLRNIKSNCNGLSNMLKFFWEWWGNGFLWSALVCTWCVLFLLLGERDDEYLWQYAVLVLFPLLLQRLRLTEAINKSLQDSPKHKTSEVFLSTTKHAKVHTRTHTHTRIYTQWCNISQRLSNKYMC